MNRGFFRSTAVVGVTTLVSRITGLAREMVFATIVPAVMLEVYVLANQIPNLLRRLFAEGAFSQAFVPVIAEYRARRRTDEVRELVDSVAGTLGGILALVSIADLRQHIPRDLAADIGELLTSGATFDGEAVEARDVAVIVENHKDARACYRALCDAGIPAVYTGDSDIFTSEAAADWLCLLEAFDQPHRSGMVRAAAAT